jgi:hypothetical protein
MRGSPTDLSSIYQVLASGSSVIHSELATQMKIKAIQDPYSNYKTSEDGSLSIKCGVMIPKSMLETKPLATAPVIVRIHGGFMVRFMTINQTLQGTSFANCLTIAVTGSSLTHPGSETANRLEGTYSKIWMALDFGSLRALYLGVGGFEIGLDNNQVLVSLPLPLFRYPRSEKDNLLLKAIF